MSDAVRGGRLAGKVALVSGSSSGIGAATVVRLREEGARVFGLDREEGAETSILVDVTDRPGVDAAVGRILEAAGAIDILANVAGVGAVGTVLDNPPEEWGRVFAVNVLGTVNLSRAVIPSMRERAGGSIVNVSSVVALMGHRQRVLYGASKGAVSALTRCMAADHRGEGIRVNAVCPGTARTPWVLRRLEGHPDAEGELERLAAAQPLGRLVDPAEVAAAIAYLASDEAAAITGIELSVDGGTSAVRFQP